MEDPLVHPWAMAEMRHYGPLEGFEAIEASLNTSFIHPPASTSASRYGLALGSTYTFMVQVGHGVFDTKCDMSSRQLYCREV